MHTHTPSERTESGFIEANLIPAAIFSITEKCVLSIYIYIERQRTIK